MQKDLLTFTDLIEAEPECVAFGNVTFIRDFGPIKKGDTFDSAWFHMEHATLEVFKDDDNKPTFVIPFILQPK